jgi:tRNA pseudouridine55 synthase
MTRKAKSRKNGQPVHGWVNLDKPVGVSSAKAVAIVRRVFNAAKAGHGGTLDPLASGVLPIALGEATKTVAFAMGSHKSYEFTLAWGVETSTDDAEGTVTQTSEKRPSEAEVLAVLPQFTGHIEQVPPAYSAIKVDGQRAYKLARKADGCEDVPAVKLAPRTIFIETCRLLSHNESEARFYVACGKGAYIRSMARDIGRAVGSAAHVTSLRRVSVGRFHADQAISLDFLENLEHSAPAFEHLHPVVSALDDIPALPISGDEASLLRHGQTLGALSQSAQMRFADLAGGQTGIAMHGDLPVALVAIKAGAVCPVRVLNL